MYFKKDWTEIKTKITIEGVDYFIDLYPFDVYESDNMCLRVYKDEEHEEECGNGLWFDSGMGWVDGNNGLYFSDDEEENNKIENYILNEVETLLNVSGVI